MGVILEYDSEGYEPEPEGIQVIVHRYHLVLGSRWAEWPNSFWIPTEL